MSGSAQTGTITTRVPARLDRLPWSRFHWRVVVGLGGVWILDGLEVTMVGNVSSRLTEHGSGIALTPADIGMAAAFYIAGACLGALFFGHLTDRFGRRNLFILTLAVYLTATVATAFAFAPWFFFLTRFFTGSGIGGEYAAINSAIDELIPARVRGRVDLVINGTYWLGSAAGAGGALVLLDTSNFPANIGWRLAFGVGALFGIFVLLVRRNIPESPRWLFIHGHNQEAERIVGEIETDVERETGQPLPEPHGKAAENPSARDDFVSRNRPGRFHALSAARDPRVGVVHRTGVSLQRRDVQSGHIAKRLLRNRRRKVPQFYILWALSNFFGPLVLGRFFDTVGRKPMIALSYIGSAVVAVVLAVLFVNQTGGVWTFIGVLAATFFLASAGASAAYLTVSEIFPMETRALAIAFFYAVGTGIGGISGPLLFGQLIESGQRSEVMWSFLIGAAVMAVAGLVELWLGVAAEQRPLEELALPLTVADAERDDEIRIAGLMRRGSHNVVNAV